MSKDPVCGMTVEVSQATACSEFEGNRYYFCCSECQRQFEATPRRYATTQQQPAPIPCCGFAAGIVRYTTQRGTA